MEKLALLISGIIFLIVSILHLLRALSNIEVKIGSYILPKWLSFLGFIFPFLLSLWLFKLVRG
ncbi:MAG: hypothetical protein NTZ63_03690 [Candidatus Omnitrophica bacterium]|nr:hypothetical protein [Candidatus Omnitrophota bacterium]